MQRIILIIVLFVTGLTAIVAQENYSITIEFKGLESDKGSLFVALYNKEDAFLKKGFKGDIVKIVDKKATVVFKDIPKGEYAISAFHDENDNKKMDTKIFGIPKEPVGISNDAKGFMGPPKYKDAKFEVTEDVNLMITIN
ncbi:uncharacterized protein (DUF2141 family) [Tenacibaculum adriaticum]|uniref:Uncharacterized protein (DUF2141 family) n=1 Tax=Tenacibaculum adriaticum TaxID=413713 RepID=A0A5S5DQ56_9FLAO|nr:DUF2141 domain-containing protein [Tenacibaculum adriaticum]TYP98080.1 uncharacterized protein (DUF2141 family) [Tenacibaculum adriaticum]